MSDTSYDARLEAFVGRTLQEATAAQDPVNEPMIRHWREAMEDPGPTDVAPATMVQAWTMRGYERTVRPSVAAGAYAELVAVLDEGGYTSVVATDSDLELHRALVPGDRVVVDEVVESVSPEKSTALGAGRFVTTLKTYRDQQGEVVATQRWRTLRFRPAAADQPDEQAEEPLAPRPRPALNRDNQFWFDAARAHRLVIQRCEGCGTLRHPPGPQCPRCQSFEWDTVEAGGRATLYSWVVAHHPRHPAFEQPYVVALVELEEGTRLITNLAGVSADDLEVGMPLVLDWLDADPELSLPVFTPVGTDEES